MNEWYTMNEAAALLGVSRQRVDQLIRAGQVPSVKRGHARFIHHNDLERARLRNTTPGPRPKAATTAS